jgi:hypothetical protein
MSVSQLCAMHKYELFKIILKYVSFVVVRCDPPSFIEVRTSSINELIRRYLCFIRLFLYTVSLFS